MKKLIMLTMIASLGLGKASAQNVNVDSTKLANGGYDIVNYFMKNAAAKGSIEFSMKYKNAMYYFISTENLTLFKSNPTAYLPQYDGFCAFAVAKMNKKVPVNPETFRIDDGKLYLFFNDLWDGEPFNTIVPWLQNEAEMEKKANENWVNLN